MLSLPREKDREAIPRFRLRGPGGGSIAAAMKTRMFCLIAGCCILSACEKPSEVVVTETRVATTRDGAPKLFATGDERFRNAKPSPVQGDAPANWLALPASQFRLLNYRFGESGMGEVWVSLSAGGVLDNVNRWRTQFGAEALDEKGLAELRTVPIVGAQGVWVESAGEYAAGMGAPPKPGFGLAGVIASVRGQILTVKMVGPEVEVKKEAAALESFAKTLRLAE